MITLGQFLILAPLILIGNFLCYRAGFEQAIKFSEREITNAINRASSVLKPSSFVGGELNPNLFKEIKRP